MEQSPFVGNAAAQKPSEVDGSKMVYFALRSDSVTSAAYFYDLIFSYSIFDTSVTFMAFSALISVPIGDEDKYVDVYKAKSPEVIYAHKNYYMYPPEDF